MFDQYRYVIGAHFLPAFINGDITGLNDDDAHAICTFAARECEGMTTWHWATDHSEEETFFARCEITHQMSDATQILLVFRRN